jgi:hypothetical protein
MAFSTIIKPSDYFNTKLYTGNVSTNAITGVGFQPDITWLKERDGTQDHYLYDAVRGVQNYLTPNLTTQEQTNVTSLTAFNSDGFTLGSNTATNANNGLFASWNWKANGAGASNTDGSINTTKTSANTTSGCSIITYTGNATAGATIGHGLGIKPSMVIIKNLAGNDWIVYTQSLTANKILYLNSTGGFNDNSVFFNDTEPTDSLITLGSISATNGSGGMIAYCFSDVQGYSKQGSYVGNGNANGTFNYTGFKPAFVMIKNYADSGGASNNGGNWRIFDNQRLGYNVNNATLYPNLSNAEADETSLDLLSNGFKMRGTTGDLNQNGMKYVYMAFAEAPFVANSGQSIPTTAR